MWISRNVYGAKLCQQLRFASPYQSVFGRLDITTWSWLLAASVSYELWWKVEFKEWFTVEKPTTTNWRIPRTARGWCFCLPLCIIDLVEHIHVMKEPFIRVYWYRTRNYCCCMSASIKLLPPSESKLLSYQNKGFFEYLDAGKHPQANCVCDRKENISH